MKKIILSLFALSLAVVLSAQSPTALSGRIMISDTLIQKLDRLANRDTVIVCREATSRKMQKVTEFTSYTEGQGRCVVVHIYKADSKGDHFEWLNNFTLWKRDGIWTTDDERKIWCIHGLPDLLKKVLTAIERKV